MRKVYKVLSMLSQELGKKEQTLSAIQSLTHYEFAWKWSWGLFLESQISVNSQSNPEKLFLVCHIYIQDVKTHSGQSLKQLTLVYFPK